MMRLCPKCGDYYADTLLAFCLTDGMPLLNVDPTSENWSEGARVIEEKENALRKQKRKLKWRRVLLSAMTMMIVTMVVLVVAANSIIYLKPKQAPTPTPTPVYNISGRVTMTDGSGIAGVTLTLSGSKSMVVTTNASGNYVLANLPAGGNYVVALSKSNYSFTTLSHPINGLDSNRTADFTGTPVSYQIRGRVTVNGEALDGVSITLSGSQSRTLTTGMNGSYAFGDLPVGGSYTITPSSAKLVFQPPSRSINKLTQDESADFVGREQRELAKCSVVDQSREHQTIINQYSAGWRRKIEGERQKINSEHVPVRIPNANGLPGFVKPEVTLGAIKYESKFPKVCTASVTASYVWQVKTESTPLAQGKVVDVPGKKRFTCAKTGETWRCR
jgi:hypothetical protein